MRLRGLAKGPNGMRTTEVSATAQTILIKAYRTSSGAQTLNTRANCNFMSILQLP